MSSNTLADTIIIIDSLQNEIQNHLLDISSLLEEETLHKQAKEIKDHIEELNNSEDPKKKSAANKLKIINQSVLATIYEFEKLIINSEEYTNLENCLCQMEVEIKSISKDYNITPVLDRMNEK